MGAKYSVMAKKFLDRLFSPVDNASLVFFRIMFGAILVWEVYRYFDYDRIYHYYIKPSFFFKYYGFEWVEPWSGHGMYVHFIAVGVLAFFILIGFLYRWSAVLFFLGFTYIFLLDQTNHLNHFYFVSLLSFLLIFIPCHRSLSIDALMRPKLRSDTAPAWSLWLLRLQIAVPYFYGGLAKLNADWLSGLPIGDWLAARDHIPLIGRYFLDDWMVNAFVYGGLLLDLLVVPLLLWRKTRLITFCFALIFHLTNYLLFSIGIFPWVMIAATLMFFDPDWPRRLIFWKKPTPHPQTQPNSSYRGEVLQKTGLILGSGYVLFQLLFPLRHFLYPGNVSWTEEGHRFSWHMKLRDKNGEGFFILKDPRSGISWDVEPEDYLTERQTDKMLTRPDMILQFAHYLARLWREKGYESVEVYAHVSVSLNGRPFQSQVDPKVNLAAEPRNLRHTHWIQPFKEDGSPRKN